jgi:exosortase
MNEQATVGILDEFQTDFVEAWRQLPNKGFFFTLLAAWLLLFQFLGNSILGYVHTPSLFRWLWEGYTSPNAAAENDRHGPLIPFVVLGLLWWKRKELFATPLKLWLPALALVVLGIVLHLGGYVLQEPRISVVALFTGIYGLTGLAWGREWLRRSFFPFFLFAFAVPMGDNLGFITFRLQLLVCVLVEAVSHNILAIDVIRQGTQLFHPSVIPSEVYQYEVAAACSGIRSLIVFLLLATGYAFLTYRSWWKRILVISMAFPFAVLGNLLRMLCIIVAAEYFGGQKSGDYVHEGGPLGILSLLPYVPAILGVLFLGGLFEKKLADKPAPNKSTPEKSPPSPP